MKTVTINVSEPVYRDFQRFAEENDRTSSELIREAMEDYRERRIRAQPSLKNSRPVSVGRILMPLASQDDILGEMLGDDQDEGR